VLVLAAGCKKSQKNKSRSVKLTCQYKICAKDQETIDYLMHTYGRTIDERRICGLIKGIAVCARERPRGGSNMSVVGRPLRPAEEIECGRLARRRMPSSVVPIRSCRAVVAVFHRHFRYQTCLRH